MQLMVVEQVMLMGGDIEEEDEIAFARSGAGQSRRQPWHF